MPKERNFNPVQAQRKAEKAKQIKKGKAELQARRNEKLAQRNPDRVQKQIDDLKAIKDGGGRLTQLEEQSLAALEADLKAIKKAREALGDQAPSFGRGGPPDGRHVLGKRRRDHEDDASSSDDQVPDDVKRIPMPRDTPPPIPKEIMDAWWAKRRAARQGNANLEPLQGDRLGHRRPDKAPAAERASGPPPEAKTVYEAKPVVRDLRREAVSAFVPTVVKVKLDKGIGKRGLLDPEEADRLEDEGYMKSSAPPAAAGDGGDTRDPHPRNVSMEDVRDEE